MKTYTASLRVNSCDGSLQGMTSRVLLVGSVARKVDNAIHDITVFKQAQC